MAIRGSALKGLHWGRLTLAGLGEECELWVRDDDHGRGCESDYDDDGPNCAVGHL